MSHHRVLKGYIKPIGITETIIVFVILFLSETSVLQVILHIFLGIHQSWPVTNMLRRELEIIGNLPITLTFLGSN